MWGGGGAPEKKKPHERSEPGQGEGEKSRRDHKVGQNSVAGPEAKKPKCTKNILGAKKMKRKRKQAIKRKRGREEPTKNIKKTPNMKTLGGDGFFLQTTQRRRKKNESPAKSRKGGSGARHGVNHVGGGKRKKE